MEENEMQLPPVPENPVVPASPPSPEGLNGASAVPAPAVAEATAAPPSPGAAPAPGRSGAGFRWFLVIILGLVIVCGLTAAVFLFLHQDMQGVSVVRMEGTMVTGDFADAETIGSEVVGRELREAADDPMIEAIVLRVNSPGGTPAAAQEIIGDLEYAKTRKPVVVSMGDVGTSAAYYVSAHADRIYANPDTFTAGIGVVWKFSDISRWMEKEGFNVSVIKSGSKKDMGSTSRPLSGEEEEYAQQVVSESFENFITDVTSQRVISRSDIEDGRVIRGAEAVRINVVDELGNLNDAIDGAKRLAKSRSKPSIPGLPS
jgi:protease-4